MENYNFVNLRRDRSGQGLRNRMQKSEADQLQARKQAKQQLLELQSLSHQVQLQIVYLTKKSPLNNIVRRNVLWKPLKTKQLHDQTFSVELGPAKQRCSSKTHSRQRGVHHLTIHNSGSRSRPATTLVHRESSPSPLINLRASGQLTVSRYNPSFALTNDNLPASLTASLANQRDAFPSNNNETLRNSLQGLPAETGPDLLEARTPSLLDATRELAGNSSAGGSKPVTPSHNAGNLLLRASLRNDERLRDDGAGDGRSRAPGAKTAVSQIRIQDIFYVQEKPNKEHESPPTPAEQVVSSEDERRLHQTAQSQGANAAPLSRPSLANDAFQLSQSGGLKAKKLRKKSVPFINQFVVQIKADSSKNLSHYKQQGRKLFSSSGVRLKNPFLTKINKHKRPAKQVYKVGTNVKAIGPATADAGTEILLRPGVDSLSKTDIGTVTKDDQTEKRSLNGIISTTKIQLGNNTKVRQQQ